MSGTPTAADVGHYRDIVIAVAMKASRYALTAFSVGVSQAGASAGAVALSWYPPTSNTDGSPLANLAGYNIYYGSSESALTNKIQLGHSGITAYTVPDLAAGTHYFGVSAYTAGGVESDIAAIGSKTIM